MQAGRWSFDGDPVASCVCRVQLDSFDWPDERGADSIRSARRRLMGDAGGGHRWEMGGESVCRENEETETPVVNTCGVLQEDCH